MSWPTLITERLILRPLSMSDLEDLATLHAEESFWRYPYGRGFSRDETEQFLERTIERYDDPGMAVSAVVVAESMELAGWAGLSVPTFLTEILPAVEVGWRLGEQYRGYGYATEAGLAWIRFGFDELALDRLVSIYEPENEASGAIMRRLGFTLDGQFTHPELGVALHVTSQSADQWSRRTRRP